MKLKNITSKIQSGFTLIELLIVIALLGALAVGLLATVDPFEQLKKGTDTSTRNTVSELYNSFIRYYALNNEFPWGTDITGLAASDASMVNTGNGYIGLVISAGELKPEFIQLAGGGLSKIFISSTSVGGFRQNVSVCFHPDSKSFAREANSKYGQDGLESSGCIGTEKTSGDTCFWCIK